MAIKKVNGGFKVFTKNGKPISKHPLPYFKALRQFEAIEIKKQRAQFGLDGVIVMVIVLLAYAGLYPILNQTISDMALTGMEELLARLIPFMILLGIALIPLKWNSNRQQGMNYG